MDKISIAGYIIGIVIILLLIVYALQLTLIENDISHYSNINNTDNFNGKITIDSSWLNDNTIMVNYHDGIKSYNDTFTTFILYINDDLYDEVSYKNVNDMDHYWTGLNDKYPEYHVEVIVTNDIYYEHGIKFEVKRS